jgi:hypothetical protein
MDRERNVMDIDRALGRALDADDPGPAFAGRVIAAVKAEAAGGAPSAVSRSGRRAIHWWAVLPIAATIALVTAGAQWRASQAEQAQMAQAQMDQARGQAARAQLVHALRLTGQQLNVVHRAIERSRDVDPSQE